VRFDGGGSQFAWHLDAGRRDSDDYEIPGFAHADAEPDDAFGVVPNSAAESQSAALGASWLRDNGFVGVGINAFDTQYGILPHEQESRRASRRREEVVRIDPSSGVDLQAAGNRRGTESVNVRLGVSDYDTSSSGATPSERSSERRATGCVSSAAQ
jgi:hypothetical protein